MKRNKIFIFQWVAWVCVTLAACSGIEDELSAPKKVVESSSETRSDLIEYTINVEKAGTLDSILEAGNYSDAQKMIITGDLTYRDIKYLNSNITSIEVLDLSGATYNMASRPNTLPWPFLPDSTNVRELSVPKNITTLETSCFNGCSSLTSITLPDGLTNIGSFAFANCSSLTHIDIPEGVTKIEMYTFYGCSSLKNITLPEGVTSIEKNAFSKCSSLTSINIPKGVGSIEEETFYQCSSLTSIEIPIGIASIGKKAFCECSSLVSIDIPWNLTSIGERAFYECTALTSVTFPSVIETPFETIIPASVESIEYETFFGCSSLTEVTLPETLKSIGESAFYKCSLLAHINIPEKVTSIGESAFYKCSSLVNIEISGNVTSIEKNVFNGCHALTYAILPNSLTSIGEYAFKDCNSLTMVNYKRPFEEGSVILPDGVTSIGKEAFRNCSAITKVTIPKGVKSIENFTFYKCSSLTSVNISEGVTSIGTDAFSDCSSLTKVIIPESVTSIGNWAFWDCAPTFEVRWNCNVSTSITKVFNSNPLLMTTVNGNYPQGYTGYHNLVLNGKAIYLDITDMQYDLRGYVISATVVDYKKTFSPSSYNIWYTISLPFEPSEIIHESKGNLAPFDSNTEEETKNFWLRELTVDGFQDVTKLEANHPYIIAMPTSDSYLPDYRLDGTVTFRARNVTLTWGSTESKGVNYTMYPAYKTIKKAKDVYAMNSEYWVDGYDNGHVFVHSAMDVNPFEAYAKPNNASATMRSVLPMADGKRTAVRGVTSSGNANSRGGYGHQKPRKEDM